MWRSRLLAVGLMLAYFKAAALGATCGSSNAATQFTLPAGFKLQIYHDGNIPNARSLAVSGNSKVTGPVITYVSALTFDPSKGPQIINAMVDLDGKGLADYVQPITSAATFEGALKPNGIAWHKNDLYIAVLNDDVWFRLYRLKNADTWALGKKTAAASDLEILRDDLPKDFWHGWKFIRFDSKGNLLIPIGAPYNIGYMNGSGVTSNIQWPTLMNSNNKGVAQQYQKADGYPKYRFASIYLFKPPYTGGMPNQKGAAPELLADGVRNTVGFDFHPQYGMYFTDNGRDDIGGNNQAITDNSPDCEINYFGATGVSTKAGSATPFFGYPYCHTGAVGGQDATPYTRAVGVGTAITDPDVNVAEANLKCNPASPGYRPAIQAAGPHVAPLGIRFYKWKGKSNFPATYNKAAFVALHGSWNRNALTVGSIGARVMTLKLSAKDTVSEYSPFVTGFLPYDTGLGTGPAIKSNGTWNGRPVDVEQLPDGSILISDDNANKVWRVVYCSGVSRAFSGGSADYGVGRCGGYSRGTGPVRASNAKMPAAKAVTSCSVRTSDDGSTPPILYSKCARVDFSNGRGMFATVAWTFKSVPGDASKIRFSSAVIFDDFDSVMGTSWLAHGLPSTTSKAFLMTGASVVISKQVDFSTASILDQQLGQPGGNCHDLSCFTSTKEGTFFDKANTVKAHMAGGSLVQRAEFLVGIDALKTWGNKIPLMVALGDSDPSTGSLKRHWLIPSFKISYTSTDLDPTISTDRVANARTVTKPAGGGGAQTAPFPKAAGGCTVNGVNYTYCADFTVPGPNGNVPVTHYYKTSGSSVDVALKMTTASSVWLGWHHNSDSPTIMANSNGNANAVILAPSGGPGATPQAAARKILTYIQTDWTVSTFFSNAVAQALPGGDYLLTFSFTYPAGQTSIMVHNGIGSWTPLSSGFVGGMTKHAATPPALCVRANGQIAPVNSCGSCD